MDQNLIDSMMLRDATKPKSFQSPAIERKEVSRLLKKKKKRDKGLYQSLQKKYK